MELGNGGTIFTFFVTACLCAKRKAARWEVTVSGHKFKIGQFVNYLGRQSASGVYQVTQLLPPEGEVFQYRRLRSNQLHRMLAGSSCEPQDRQGFGL
jgi:hypothetical protein